MQLFSLVDTEPKQIRAAVMANYIKERLGIEYRVQIQISVDDSLLGGINVFG